MIADVACAELNGLIEDMWESMANMKVVPSPEPPTVDRENVLLVSSVQIVGDWEGAVQLEMSLGVARETTSNMIGVEESEVPQDSIRDAAGELVNMVGGGVKAFLPPNCFLSLPSVVIGNDFESAIPQGNVVHKSGFVANSGDITVTIIERELAG
jgi:chemotaxis protein CheX